MSKFKQDVVLAVKSEAASAGAQVLAQLQSVVSGIKPTPRTFQRVPVKVVPWTSPVFVQYMEYQYQAFEAAVSMQGGELRFSYSDFVRYCITLFNQRCTYAATGRSRIRPVERIVVPAFLNLVLNQIGLAKDDTLGVEFVPEYYKEEVTLATIVEEVRKKSNYTREERLLAMLFDNLDSVDSDEDEDFDPSKILWCSNEEMHAISNNMSILKRFGFVFADEPFNRNREGDFGFMSMQVVEERVMSHNDTAAPVVAVLASVVSLTQVQQVLLPRVDYGPTTYFRSLMSAITSPASLS